MKRGKIFALAALFGLASVFSWVGIAKAQLVTANVGKHQAIDGSVYSAGEEVKIDGLVNGDVHCVGQKVVISGTVKGDVLCAAQDLTISGTVEGSIRAAAQTMVIKGSVGHSATLAADSLTLAKDATIGQDATVAAASAVIRGQIDRDLVVAAGDAQLFGAIGRNVVMRGQTITLKDKAKVAGNIRYTSDQSISIGDNATVVGDVSHETPAKSDKGISSGFIFMLLMGALFFSLVLVLLWPQLMHATSDIAVRSLGKTMLVGALAPILGLLTIIAFMLSGVGVPVAIFLILAAILIMMLSGPVAAYYFGSMVLAKSKNPVAIMLVGSVILLVAYLIPVVGALASIAAYLIGSGAILLKIKRSMPRPIYRVE